jgi:hypothetical protein
MDVPSRNGLSFVGNGATIKMLGTTANTPGNFNIITVDGGSNISFTNLTLVGDNTSTAPSGTNAACSPSGSLEWQYGIAFNGTSTGSVTNANIKNICGDFIEMQPYLEPDGLFNWSQPATHISVSGGTFSVAGRQGITVEDGSGVTISGITMSHVGQAAIDVEQDAVNGIGYNVTLTGSTFTGIGAAVMSNWGLAPGPNSGDITVTNNSETNTLNCLPMVWVQTPSGDAPRSGYVVTGNNFPLGQPLGEFGSVNNVTVENNSAKGAQNNCGYNYALKGTNVNTATVENNNLGSTVTVLSAGSGNTNVTACGNSDGLSNLPNLPTSCPV